jgi:hypothetical protein
VQSVTDHVMGIDVHPVSVILAAGHLSNGNRA